MNVQIQIGLDRSWTTLLSRSIAHKVMVIIQYLGHTDLLSHRFDPPVLSLSWRRVGRSRHLHLAGVSRKTVWAAVKTRQKVLQRNTERERDVNMQLLLHLFHVYTSLEYWDDRWMSLTQIYFPWIHKWSKTTLDTLSVHSRHELYAWCKPLFS